MRCPGKQTGAQANATAIMTSMSNVSATGATWIPFGEARLDKPNSANMLKCKC